MVSQKIRLRMWVIRNKDGLRNPLPLLSSKCLLSYNNPEYWQDSIQNTSLVLTHLILTTTLKLGLISFYWLRYSDAERLNTVPSLLLRFLFLFFAKMSHILSAGLGNFSLEGHLVKNFRPWSNTSSSILTSFQVSVSSQATEQIPCWLLVLCINRYLRNVIWLAVLKKGTPEIIKSVGKNTSIVDKSTDWGPLDLSHHLLVTWM